MIVYCIICSRVINSCDDLDSMTLEGIDCTNQQYSFRKIALFDRRCGYLESLSIGDSNYKFGSPYDVGTYNMVVRVYFNRSGLLSYIVALL